MLPNPKMIRQSHPVLHRLVSELLASGMRLEDAEVEAALLLEQQRELESRESLDRLTEEYGVGF